MKSYGKISIGAWNKLPHYSLVGKPCDFYVFIDEKGHSGVSSKWITGKSHLWYELERLLKRDKKAFVDKIKELYRDNKGGNLCQ